MTQTRRGILVRSLPLRRGLLVRRTRPRRTQVAMRVKRDDTQALWYRYILTRYGFTCQKCGRSKAQGYKIQAAHILSVSSYPQLRYDLENGIALCGMPCHIPWYDQHKSSTHDGESDRWVRGKIGDRAYQDLLARAAFTRRPDKALAREHLRQLLREMQ